jgi:acyl phosphate:glycerol-3-phosphate acyltransferase
MYLLWLLVGFVAVLGHMFSIFLRFKGGKGVATSAGMMLGLVPYYTYPGLIGIGIFLVAVMLTRYISVGSLAGAASFPMLYALMCYLRGWPMLREQLPLLIFAMIMALLIIWKHRGNIARLMAGTENRLGSRGA